MVEDGDSITASVTTNDTDFTVVSRTFTPTGGTGKNLTVTKTDNSITADIDAEMRTTGGEISIVVACENDLTQTATITYTVAKVYTINLAELSRVGDIVSGSVTTNNTTYTPTVTLDGTNVDPSLITVETDSISVDVTGLTGLLSITVTCDTDRTKSSTKTFTLI